VPLPSCPSPLRPQQLTAPVLSSAHAWYEPAVIETAVAPPVNAPTSTGAELRVVVLLPSCPYMLSPQQLTTPVLSTAHVWYLPAVIETAVAPPVNASTNTGAGLSLLDD